VKPSTTPSRRSPAPRYCTPCLQPSSPRLFRNRCTLSLRPRLSLSLTICPIDSDHGEAPAVETPSPAFGNTPEETARLNVVCTLGLIVLLRPMTQPANHTFRKPFASLVEATR
jgi:hypothetical protein